MIASGCPTASWKPRAINAGPGRIGHLVAVPALTDRARDTGARPVPELTSPCVESAKNWRASVRRHRRAQGGSPELRSIRPTRAVPKRRESPASNRPPSEQVQDACQPSCRGMSERHGCRDGPTCFVQPMTSHPGKPGAARPKAGTAGEQVASGINRLPWLDRQG